MTYCFVQRYQSRYKEKHRGNEESREQQQCWKSKLEELFSCRNNSSSLCWEVEASTPLSPFPSLSLLFPLYPHPTIAHFLFPNQNQKKVAPLARFRDPRIELDRECLVLLWGLKHWDRTGRVLTYALWSGNGGNWSDQSFISVVPLIIHGGPAAPAKVHTDSKHCVVPVHGS